MHENKAPFQIEVKYKFAHDKNPAYKKILYIKGKCDSNEYVLVLGSKDKFVPILFLTEHDAMKAYWGVEL
jgi:hypothetical protein